MARVSEHLYCTNVTKENGRLRDILKFCAFTNKVIHAQSKKTIKPYIKGHQVKKKISPHVKLLISLLRGSHYWIPCAFSKKKKSLNIKPINVTKFISLALHIDSFQLRKAFPFQDSFKNSPRLTSSELATFQTHKHLYVKPSLSIYVCVHT